MKTTTPKEPKPKKQKTPKVKKTKSKNYLNNKDLHDELVFCIENNTTTTKLIEMFKKIIKHQADVKYWVDSEDKKDCCQNALINCWKNYTKFNPEKGQAFAFITQLAYMGLAEGWNFLHPKTKGRNDTRIVRLSYFDEGTKKTETLINI